MGQTGTAYHRINGIGGIAMRHKLKRLSRGKSRDLEV
jgi:hypothetical protein